MRDMHCHILPGVDDGASSLSESLAMLDAAKQAGITEIVCTPHCRDPFFDYDAMWDAFEMLREHTDIPLSMGFEVYVSKLRELGDDWIDRLAFDATDEFLLELQYRATPTDFGEYERIIFTIQGKGYQVIIAHPERCLAIQEDPDLAYRLVRMGCKLQASADFIIGGRFDSGEEKKRAKHMFKEGLYSYIASDAHNVEHYQLFSKVMKKYGDALQIKP